MTDHVYFILDEPKDRIRIGSTHNLINRLFTHLNQLAGQRWIVLGVIEGGVGREKEIHAMFAELRLERESRRGHEVAAASDEWFRNTPVLRAWIEQNAKPWDGSDKFNWQSNIPSPTLAMHCSAEWMGLGGGFRPASGASGRGLVERALAARAEKERRSPRPARYAS